MEISAQQQSNGILYEGYTDEFKLCIFEDGVIQGRNERYEFRCDANLECCGRTCCTPTDATIPLWLLLLFIILGLLLLCLLLSALAYWLSKRPRKPKIKKDYRSDLNNSGGYRTIRHVDDDANKEYSALDESAAANRNGYGNRGYDISTAEQGRRLRRRGSDSDEDGGYFRSNVGANNSANVNTSHLTRYPNDPPRRNSWHEHETYEEEFKEEIEYERSAASSPTSSRERLTKI